MPFDDLREKDGLAFAEISFLVASGQHAQPDEQASVREKESIFTLVDIRKAPGRFEPELRDITGILHPVQAMCDWAMKELASANRKGPPYEPYMVPSLAATPWAPRTSGHAAALSSWEALPKQANRDLPPQEVSLHAFCLYRMSFLVAASLRRASDPFGGIAPEISHFPTAPPPVTR